MNDDPRIREIAYQIWQVEGQPQGQHGRHWDMARKLVEADRPRPQTPAANTVARPRPAVAKALPTVAGSPAVPTVRKRRRAGAVGARPAD